MRVVVGNTVVLDEPSALNEPLVEGQSVTIYIDEGWTLDEASTHWSRRWPSAIAATW